MSTNFSDHPRYELNSGVWVPRDNQAVFAYTDGDEVESRIGSIIEQATDKTVFSQELRKGITDWPSFYHLSSGRANLLRPYAKKIAGKTVLEIGSGCGAITRFLGETAASVVAIEGSFDRAGITLERTRDLPNVQVVCDQIPGFSVDTRFDVIVVIGVLEYARTTLAELACPELEFAKSLRPLLKRNGVIMLAIENQLGVKYFSGAKEDHTGQAFYGISNQYRSKTPVTFGRQVLSDLLSEAGFLHQDWHYPFPDYKVPMSIVSEACLERLPSLATALIAASGSSDPQRAPNPLFSIEAIWDVLSRNRLIGELANSFIVVAGETARSTQTFRDSQALAWHYSDSSRHPAFMKEVRFDGLESKFVVRRTALTNAARPDLPIRCHMIDEPYIAGTNWWLELVSIVNTPGWAVADIAAWCELWLDQLFSLLKSEKMTLVRDSTMLMPGRYMDAVPFNLIFTREQGGRFIDQEWELDRDIALGFLLYRSLYASLIRISGVAEPEINTSLKVFDLIRGVAVQVKIPISDVDLRRFHDLEHTVQQWVQGKSGGDIDQNLFELRKQETMFCRQTAGADNEQAALKAVLTAAQEELRQLRDEVTNRNNQIKAADTAQRRLMAEIEDRDRRLVEAADKLATSIVIAQKDRQILTDQIHEGENRLRAADAGLRNLVDHVEDRERKLAAADGDLRRMMVEIEDRDRKLAATGEDMHRLMDEVKDRDQKLTAADGDLRRMMVEIEDRHQKLVVAGEDLHRLMDEVKDRGRKLTAADGDLRRLMGEIEDREQKLTAAGADLRRLMVEIEDRDRKLVGADGDLRRLMHEVKDREQKLTAADDGLRRLSGEIEDRDQKLMVADAGLRSLNAEIEDRDFRLHRLTDEISSIKEQLEERERQLKALEQRLHDIETSRTWRITAPVRKLFSNSVGTLSRSNE